MESGLAMVFLWSVERDGDGIDGIEERTERDLYFTACSSRFLRVDRARGEASEKGAYFIAVKASIGID